ncbi:sialate O-acetylesterase-like [Tubulanus polymorphus]|uniref:sialate O-acetylesterase-like n=1 Tax=Tubulanus polymorphus TaxID=672921 RepID=UPI003DA5117E
MILCFIFEGSLGGDPFTYFSAVCWLYGKALYERLRYPIGLIESCVSGTPVEYWMSKDAFTSCNLHRSSVHDNSLWNAMINPLLNMTIYGSIWYQGESNAMHNRHNYNCTFPAMIADWRLKFSSHSQTDHQFPFGFVQLAPDNDESMVNNFPEIRWHQTADYGYVPNPKMNNVFMAVAIDLPDSTSPWGRSQILSV